MMVSIGDIISNGANDFLFTEYKVLAVFLVGFSFVLFIAVDVVGNDNNVQFYTTFAFILGAITSIVSGFIGMRIAVYSNTRTAYMA
jgi:inorganic pyrophosphatase